MKAAVRLLCLAESSFRLRSPLFFLNNPRVFFISNLNYDTVALSAEENRSSNLDNGNFIPAESQYYHSVLEKDPKYTNTILTAKYFENLLNDAPASSVSLENDTSNLSPQLVCPLFFDVTRKILSNELDAESQELTPLVFCIKRNYKHLTAEEMKNILALLYLWPGTNKLKNRILKNILFAMDAACVSYMLKTKDPSIEEILLLMDTWHWLNLCSLSEFVQMSTGKLFWRADKHAHIIQLFMYMSELRTLPNHYDRPAIEKKVIRFIRYFKSNEIGIMAAGFFKTRTKLTNYALYKRIIDRVVKEPEKLHDISLNAVLKLLRSSIVNFYKKEDVEAVLGALASRIPHLSGMSLVQVAMLGTPMEVNDRQLMISVLRELSKHTRTLREKDLQRIMYACAVSLDENDVKHFVKEIVREVYERDLTTLHEQKNEGNYNPWVKRLISFMEIVLYLHIMGYRSEELIAAAIQTGLTLNVKPMETSSLQHLDAIVDILFPDYKGPRLDEELKHHHHKCWFPANNVVFPVKHWFSFEWREANPERLRKLYLDLCNAVGGDTYVGSHSILPLYEHKDFVVCLDKDGKFIPIPKNYGLEPHWEAKRPVDTEDKTFVVLMLLRDRAANGVPDYSLYQRLRRELLQKLGYRIAVMRYNIFDDLTKDAKTALILEAIEKAE